MNVLDMRPETLADTVDPVLVERELRWRPGLEMSQMQALVYALDYWVVETIERPTDLESVLLLDRICALAPQCPLSGLWAEEFRSNLGPLRSLLEVKRQCIASRLSGQRPRQASRVITELKAGPISQGDLGRRLGLSVGRTNQLLGVMEERGLVSRIRKGGELQVNLSHKE